MSTHLARIIHQPEKSTREGPFGARMIFPTAVSQAAHSFQTNASACLGTFQLGLIMAPRHNSPYALSGQRQPLRTAGAKALDQAHTACLARRTQANKVKLRFNTGATGHDEGNEILIRS
jgi:hypothetical protein